MPAAAETSDSDESAVKWRSTNMTSRSKTKQDDGSAESPKRRRHLKEPRHGNSEGVSPLTLGSYKSDIDDFDFDGNQSSTSTRKGKFGRHFSKRLSHLMEGRHNHQLIQSLSSESVSGSFDPKVHGAQDMAQVLNEIVAWVQEEKSKRKQRKSKRKLGVTHLRRSRDSQDQPSPEDSPKLKRRRSDASESSIALEKLENIVGKGLTASQLDKTMYRKTSSVVSRKSSVIRKLRRQSTAASSDTEYPDGAMDVPTCKAFLDNSQTLSYSGGGSVAQTDLTELTRVPTKDDEAWLKFKFEIVRLTHTLKLRGWRNVPMDRCSEIDVERLSGALTNAVYTVCPPPDMRLKGGATDNPAPGGKRRPVKLLLRIYGPYVEHLINREKELQILRRLAKKRIGARLLGTFSNGRFEEFLEATTLKPQDLRVPETSKQIAKRMRELHEGIELEEEERNAGPFVWQNWDSWVDRCEPIIKFVDEQVLSNHPTSPDADTMKRRGLVCGVEWPTFRRTVENYRRWLDTQYGGPGKVKEALVFAHNDTQYGNILRINPPSRSPLLLPRNHHRQLVVIDFEYSNANVPGFEFANHFTEWCYNYHSTTHSFVCNTSYYPTIEEQNRFLQAYIVHHPTANSNESSQMPTPKQRPNDASIPSLNSTANSVTSSVASSRANTIRSASTASLSNFTLDARIPRTGSPPPMRDEDEDVDSMVNVQTDRETNLEIQRLRHEARLWRVACSAQWVVWGIVQAHVPGFAEEHGSPEQAPSPASSDTYSGSVSSGEPLPVPTYAASQITGDDKDSDGTGQAGQEQQAEETGEEEGFDYLSYAQDRAMFFWGDCLQLGLVGKDELPEALRDRVKFVAY